MAKYIVLGKFTASGRQGLQDAPQRRAQGTEVARTLGITFDGYLTLGPYDLVWVLDAPSEEAVAKWVLGLSTTGSFETQTMRAFSEAEMDALIAAVPRRG
jgi:uncharacterized protein with GYD domain